ncbi:MAG: protein-L-isoaspartate(D-aspartate) O-methyltransferase [Ekhidna sp.]
MKELKDTYKHKGLRKQLVKEIIAKGIKNDAVLSAIGRIPRHYFFDNIFEMHAYEDKAFPIASGQTISQPYTVAFQSELLQIVPGAKILEIGTGSGYQASVLVELGADVYTIEYQKPLYQKAIRFLPSIGYQPHMYHGDGSKGMPRFAPYDGIIVTAGAPTIPNDLLQQLKIGGRLVIPVGDNDKQAMILIEKVGENKIKKKVFNDFSFVPLLGSNGWANPQ